MTVPYRPSSLVVPEVAAWCRVEIVRLETIAVDDVRYRVARELLAFWRWRCGCGTDDQR